MLYGFLGSAYYSLNKKKYLSDYEALNDPYLSLEIKNEIKLKLGMYSSVNEIYINDIIYLIKYYILIQDIEGLDFCFNSFEKIFFISNKKKLLILTLLFPFLNSRVVDYSRKKNIKHILSYVDYRYIKYNLNMDKYLLQINSQNEFNFKEKTLNLFLEKQSLSRIFFDKNNFSIKSMNGLKKEVISLNLVSVILTVYNCRDYVDVAIKSILNQDYTNIELIIVDDCSNDGTIEILKNYDQKDSRIKIIFLQENIGAYKARNIALKKINGKFIAFQDADDYSHVSRISESVKILEYDSKKVAVSSKYVRINDIGQFVSPKGIPLIRWSPLTLVFRREILDLLFGFDEVRFGADSEFFSRIIAFFGKNSHVIINKVMMFCLDRNNSLMKKDIHFYGFSKNRNVYQDLYNHRILINLNLSKNLID
ncbi:glycosyltransferase family 2 protein [Acinetobacter terrestris]|uniref:glycosyltransferase family 2 protein n=1 Tax=Acinetobacter terrestris TaxID=2529843 RepID=UPI00103F9403|nr:glycosyltransferase family A protein [Acinetobacter terrestris]TCB46518.1 glycosyltransferase family 2 protein [Acinetobacter terrestris]